MMLAYTKHTRHAHLRLSAPPQYPEDRGSRGDIGCVDNALRGSSQIAQVPIPTMIPNRVTRLD